MKFVSRANRKVRDWWIESKVEAEHAWACASPTAPLVRLGTEYGGWWLPENAIGPNDFVISAGAGEDISFEIALTKRYGCRIVILDPTPRAVAHFESTRTAIAENQPALINNSAKEFYEASAEDFSRLTFHAWGLWNENTTKRFFAPVDPKYVSHSIGDLHDTGRGFDATCVTLEETLEREGIGDLSVLKIDIEGAEFEVLDDMLISGLRPKCLLVEFHSGQNDIERQRRSRTLAMLRRLHGVGYRLVKRHGWDYVLELQSR